MATKNPPSDKAEVGNQSYYATKKPLIDPNTPKYLNHPEPKKNKQKNYKNAEIGAPNKDKPTTADAKKGVLDLPSVMSAVDPQGISSIAPMMFSMLGSISASSSGSSESSRKDTLEQTFAGAMAILSNKYTFADITKAFYKALKNDKIDLVEEKYQKTLKNSLALLYINYKKNGKTLQVNSYDIVENIGPPPKPIVKVVPDFYLKQYYPVKKDPYPGYTEWVSPDGTHKVYKEKSINSYHFSTPQEEVFSTTERLMADLLEPYVVDNNLTPSAINSIFEKADANIQNQTQENTGGQNSSNKLMSVLMQLAGYAGNIVNLQQSVQLPVSVLNKGGITSSFQSYLSNMASIKLEKNLAQQASQPLSAISSLSSLATQAVGTATSLRSSSRTRTAVEKSDTDNLQDIITG